MEDAKRRLYGVQFHPEVTHTDFGTLMLHNFLYDVCGCSGGWTMDDFIARSVEKVPCRAGGQKSATGAFRRRRFSGGGCAFK